MELISISSAVGAHLGLFLVLGLEEGRWSSLPVPEPCSCTGIPTLDSHCLGWHQESVSLQDHVGGLDWFPGAVFSLPQAGRGWEHCTDSTACICNGLHSTFPSLECTKAACEIAQAEDWSLEV